MKDPYSILGLGENASKEELENRYNELKAKLSEDRFLPGAEGNSAAKQLTELDSAWLLINEKFNKQEEKQEFGTDYGVIDDLIKKGSFDDAQARLDAISDRNGEWHYMQSIVFYKREWMTDCRKQLEIALQLEPRNDKYKTALEKLNLVMGNPKAEQQTMGANPMYGDVPPEQAPGAGAGNCLSSCCLAYCCTDCCCSITRCCG